MKETILKVVENNHVRTNSKCGVPFPFFLQLLKVTDKEFKDVVREMHKNKEVEVREGINGFMLTKPRVKNKNNAFKGVKK